MIHSTYKTKTRQNMPFKVKNEEGINKINEDILNNMGGEMKINWSTNLTGLFSRIDALSVNEEKVRYSTTRRMDKGYGASVTNYYWDSDDFKITEEIYPNERSNIHSHYTAGDGKILMDRPIWKKQSRLKRFINKILRRRPSEPVLTTTIEKGTKSPSQTISTSFNKDKESINIIDPTPNAEPPQKTNIYNNSKRPDNNDMKQLLERAADIKKYPSSYN